MSKRFPGYLLDKAAHKAIFNQADSGHFRPGISSPHWLYVANWRRSGACWQSCQLRANSYGLIESFKLDDSQYEFNQIDVRSWELNWSVLRPVLLNTLLTAQPSLPHSVCLSINLTARRNVGNVWRYNYCSYLLTRCISELIGSYIVVSFSFLFAT